MVPAYTVLLGPVIVGPVLEEQAALLIQQAGKVDLENGRPSSYVYNHCITLCEPALLSCFSFNRSYN